ncbi:MAG: hypothetical protein ABS55_08660 [Lautropia sp. SCN 70-15]|nr:MAG: hypothetical protein ABS55_08660 [Lautropia sp. SCN 70-15]
MAVSAISLSCKDLKSSAFFQGSPFTLEKPPSEPGVNASQGSLDMVWISWAEALADAASKGFSPLAMADSRPM